MRAQQIMAQPQPLRIGTRGSPMALIQAGMVRDRLAAEHRDLAAPDAIEIIVIRTTGDRVQDRPLYEIGGKALFTKEIEEALLHGAIDLAVHSMKDVATWLPPGLAIACLLPRDDPRDAFLSHRAATLRELPQGAVLGTASPRRAAQVLHLRPDLRIVSIRGNAGTRIRKLAAGECDATLLSLAGLRRIKEEGAIASIVSTEDMLPAATQGAIGIECRADDRATRGRLVPLHHAATASCIEAERALLAALGGSCRTPIAALAELADGVLSLRGMVISPDGVRCHRVSRCGAVGDAEALGSDAGTELHRLAGPDFFVSPP
jgi:hydroxymethylbilane synthase